MGRLLIVMWLIIIIGGGIVLNHKLNPDPYADALNAADTFFTAYSNCDLNTAKQYYLPLQNNAQQAQKYLQDCKKGQMTFTEDHRQSAQTSNQNGTQSKNVSYIYNYTDNSSGQQQAGQMMVYMIWSKALGHWYVFSLTPTSLNGYNGQQQQ